LWAKDASLWRGPNGQKRSVGGNLAWLDLPEQVGAYMNRVSQLAEATKSDGFQDVVFIAMGDSNLAAETLLTTSAEKTIWKSVCFGWHRSGRNSRGR
jgi:glucose-6-phosphate isomerase